MKNLNERDMDRESDYKKVREISQKRQSRIRRITRGDEMETLKGNEELGQEVSIFVNDITYERVSILEKVTDILKRKEIEEVFIRKSNSKSKG